MSELDGFRSYLADFGLTDGTIAIYVHHLKRANEEGGWVPRLKKIVAPKTKRLARAAARHYATWTDDAALRKSLDKLRLPAPRRQAAKVPLDRAVLFKVMDEIATDKKLTPAMRAVLGLMACRGFRDGDVLRMKRTEVLASLTKGTLAYEAKGGRRLEFLVIRTFKRWLDLLGGEVKWTRVDELIAPASKNERARRQSAARAVQRALRRIGERVGVPELHPHQLRRTYAVEYLRAHKGDPEALMKLTQHMQWANMQTAMQYVDHLRGAELDSVAETMFDR